MILTTCAACAAPLAHDAPRCVRCKLRYCNATCQHDHWRRGHKQMCKKIHRGGNAEQYNADKKYKEALAEAVEACADHDVTLRFRWLYANCLCDYKNATLDDVVKAVETLESVAKVWKRLMGERHPETAKVLKALKEAREMLRLRRAASD